MKKIRIQLSAICTLLFSVAVCAGEGHDVVSEATQLAVPKGNKLVSLKQQTSAGAKEWLTNGPVSNQTIVIEPGHYVYLAKPEDVFSPVEVAFDIAAGQTMFVHLVSTPDLKHVITWPSLFDRDSSKFEEEKQERFCTSVAEKGTAYRDPVLPEYAISACEQAAQSGSSMALTQLGYIYKIGTSEVKKDLRKAVEYLQASAKKGDARGLYLLGVTQLYDLPASEQAAGIANLKKAAMLGFPYADGQAAAYLVDHAQTAKDFDLAKQHAVSAVRYGDNLGMLALVHIALKAKKFQPDFLEAAKWTTLMQFNAAENSYQNSSLFGKVEAELTDKQLNMLKRQSGQNLKAVAGDVSSICVVAHLKDPELKNGKVRININRVDLDWQDTSKPVFFDGLMMADRAHNLRIYVNDELKTNVEFNAKRASSDTYIIDYNEKSLTEFAHPVEAITEQACLSRS